MAIASPELNTDSDRRYFQKHPFDILKFCRQFNLDLSKIRAVDLYSGDGYVGEYLEQIGCRRVTCIDCRKPNPSASSTLKWEHLDLEDIAFCSRTNQTPPKLEHLKRFDLLTCFNAFDPNGFPIIQSQLFALARFFLKPDGFIISDTYQGRINT